MGNMFQATGPVPAGFTRYNQGPQSSNPYGENYRPPTGPQGGTPVGPTTVKAGSTAATPVETEEERRRRQALILGAMHEGVGDGGTGGGPGTGTGTGGSGDDGTGGGTGATY